MKKVLIILALALLVVLPLTAGGNKEAKNPDTLRVLLSEEPSTGDAFTATLNKWAEETGKTLDIMVIPYDDQLTKFPLMARNNDLPDLIATTRLTRLYPEEFLDLTEYVNIDDFEEQAVMIIGQDYTTNKNYCLPYQFTITNVFYNKDAFEKAGITPPTVDDPWTLEEYRENAQILQEKGGVKYGMAMDNSRARYDNIMYMYGGSMVEKDGDSFKVCFPASEQGWNLVRLPDESEKILDGHYQGQTVSPWRTVVMAGDLDGLVNSDMITNLCPAPAEDMDFSWVKPGRCLWQWWSSGAPKYEEQRAWYDAAVALGWEYYLIDEGWSWWKQEGRSPWDMLTEVIAYGKSQGVKSIVWVNSAEMRHAPERRAYLERVKAIGAAGIKIDFIPRATTEVMQWYMGAMQDCAELGLLLNLHGSVKPTGLSRTYPNDITREAVRGNEYQIRRYGRVLPQDHYVSLPFTRLLAGPADLTPVTLNPEEIAVGGYSWAHEMSQAIVFLSPVLHFSDHYSYYLESPMRDLLSEVPTTWDETLVLPCTEMGKVVAYARRKGNDWWIGVMNGDQPREISIFLDFLKGKGKAALVYDDATRLDGVKREDRDVSPQETLRMKLRPGGGFVARISK